MDRSSGAGVGAGAGSTGKSEHRKLVHIRDLRPGMQNVHAKFVVLEKRTSVFLPAPLSCAALFC